MGKIKYYRGNEEKGGIFAREKVQKLGLVGGGSDLHPKQNGKH